jgi:LuxR family maltose regulon positive regulatory protein
MLFISNRLKEKLSKMAEYPLTLIEADSGYGKTATVRQWFSGIAAKDYDICWYSCLRESGEVAWKNLRGILQELSQGQWQSSVQIPNKEYSGQLALEMQRFQIQKPGILIIDNFAQMEGWDAISAIHALSMHHCDKFHIIILSRPLQEHILDIGFMNPAILKIMSEDFSFTDHEIYQYVRG